MTPASLAFWSLIIVAIILSAFAYNPVVGIIFVAWVAFIFSQVGRKWNSSS